MCVFETSSAIITTYIGIQALNVGGPGRTSRNGMMFVVLEQGILQYHPTTHFLMRAWVPGVVYVWYALTFSAWWRLVNMDYAAPPHCVQSCHWSSASWAQFLYLVTMIWSWFSTSHRNFLYESTSDSRSIILISPRVDSYNVSQTPLLFRKFSPSPPFPFLYHFGSHIDFQGCSQPVSVYTCVNGKRNMPDDIDTRWTHKPRPWARMLSSLLSWAPFNHSPTSLASGKYPWSRT